MNDQPQNQPRFLLWFFRLYTLLGAVPVLANTVDIFLNPSAQTLENSSPGTRLLMGLLIAPLTIAIAILCIRRAPGNLIGWLVIAFGYGVSVQVARVNLAPLVIELLIAKGMISMFWSAYILIPLYFPDGRLYPPAANRWGNLIIVLDLVFNIIITTICVPQLEWGIDNALTAPNPLFLFEWDYTVVTRPVGIAMLLFGILVLFLRYRGSSHATRLQMRWLFLGVLFQTVITIILLFRPPELDVLDGWISALYNLVTPVTIGIAVLRYRLYDIDLIIRRTLQYGLLSLLLGLVYYGLVVLLGQVFQSVTGQRSPLVIVISTLAIAALANPLRRRIQNTIDRRFFRARYNADQAAAAFSAVSRSQVELDVLASRLAQTAQEALQPDGVWVWMQKK